MMVLRVKRNESQRGDIGMGSEWNAESNPITGIPTAAWASPVEEHLHTCSDSLVDHFRHAANRVSPKGDQRVGRWHDPTAGARCPGPAVFVGIELNLPIGNAKLQVPEPV